MDTPKLLKIAEVAVACRVSKRAVERWIEAKTLSSVRLAPKTVRVREAEVLRFLAASEAKHA
ncbi:MAG: helix-turn-helix transcriptional regulator [Polyangiaceae bacterium]